MKHASHIGLVLGLAALIGLVVWQGMAAVGGLLLASGWWLLLLPLAWLPYFVLSTVSWRLLFPPARAPGVAATAYAWWLGYSVNTLLPVASIGGEVVKARVVALSTKRGADAGASVVVDLTVQAISLVAGGLIGAAALVALKAEAALTGAALGGAALLAAGTAGFIYVQHGGALGALARLGQRASTANPLRRLADGAAETDAAIRALYHRPRRIAYACAWRVAARVALTSEVWLAAILIGHPVGLVVALMLETLSGALRGMAFVVPSGIGVQEAGFVALGALIGQPPEVMLGLSLATRVRELLVGLPGVLAWQHTEGRALWRRLFAGPS